MLPLANCDITAVEKTIIAGEMEAGLISGTGRRVAEFEDCWKKVCTRKHAIAVSNGTIALELALSALDLREGDEVIVPALTFAAPAAAVRRMGGKVVLADVDEETWTISVERVRELITPRTVAIIAVDVLGHPADYWPLQDLANEHGLWLIEDAAEAHCAFYHNVMTGSFGDLAIFSFHANKTITTGEGGIILTDDDKLADHIRLMANHGMRQSRPYYHEIVGTNARMTNLTAAIGVAQMSRMSEIMYKRRLIAMRYAEIIRQPFTLRPVASWAEPMVWLQAVRTEYGRDEAVEHLRSFGIDARALWVALPDLPLYYQAHGCQVARRISQQTFWLPTYNQMGDAEFDIIANALGELM